MQHVGRALSAALLAVVLCLGLAGGAYADGGDHKSSGKSGGKGNGNVAEERGDKSDVHRKVKSSDDDDHKKRDNDDRERREKEEREKREHEAREHEAKVKAEKEERERREHEAREKEEREKREHEKVALCHATGSASNPFVSIEVDKHALDAHMAHGDRIRGGGDSCSQPSNDHSQKDDDKDKVKDHDKDKHDDKVKDDSNKDKDEHEKVVLCHATGSASNPFVVIEVDMHAKDAHMAHGDRVVNGDASCKVKSDDDKSKDTKDDKDKDDDDKVKDTKVIVKHTSSKDDCEVQARVNKVKVVKVECSDGGCLCICEADQDTATTDDAVKDSTGNVSNTSKDTSNDDTSDDTSKDTSNDDTSDDTSKDTSDDTSVSDGQTQPLLSAGPGSDIPTEVQGASTVPTAENPQPEAAAQQQPDGLSPGMLPEQLAQVTDAPLTDPMVNAAIAQPTEDGTMVMGAATTPDTTGGQTIAPAIDDGTGTAGTEATPSLLPTAGDALNVLRMLVMLSAGGMFLTAAGMMLRRFIHRS